MVKLNPKHFIVYDNSLDNAVTTEEAEQAHVNRRVAEMDLHRHLYGINNAAIVHRNDQDAAYIDALKLQYVQRRWECLYDVEEHLRLRGAIMDHIND